MTDPTSETTEQRAFYAELQDRLQNLTATVRYTTATAIADDLQAVAEEWQHINPERAKGWQEASNAARSYAVDDPSRRNTGNKMTPSHEVRWSGAIHHLPATWTDERRHELDETCWCIPVIDVLGLPRAPRVYHFRPGRPRTIRTGGAE
jgi:hypothetical protein